MSAISSQNEEIEKLPAKLCRCRRQPELVRTMLSVQTGRHVRMFECRCGERILDDESRFDWAASPRGERQIG